MTDILLPPNATDLERAFDAATGARVDAVDFSPLRSLKDPQTIPAGLLPWLAWERSVDTWADGLSEAQRRAIIEAAPDLHRLKGTPAAIRLALQSIGLADVEIEEGLPALMLDGSWLVNGSETLAGGRRWALFRVIADLGQDVGLDVGQVAAIRAVITRAKNVRSHLYSITWRANVRAVGGPATLISDIRVGLGLRAAKGVLDGRYRLRGRARPRLDGAWSLDGATRLGDSEITPTGAPVLYLGTPPAGAVAEHPGEIYLRSRIRVRVAAAAPAAPNVHLDGRLDLDGSWRLGSYHPGPHRRPIRVRRHLHLDGVTHPLGWGAALDGAWPLNGRTALGRVPRLGPVEYDA